MQQLTGKVINWRYLNSKEMLYQKNSVWGFTKLPRLLVCLTIPILDCWQLYLPFWLCLTRTSSTCCLREAGLRWRSCSCRSRRQPLQPLQIRWECTNTVFQTRTNDSKLNINIIILGGGRGCYHRPACRPPIRIRLLRLEISSVDQANVDTL